MANPAQLVRLVHQEKQAPLVPTDDLVQRETTDKMPKLAPKAHPVQRVQPDHLVPVVQLERKAVLANPALKVPVDLLEHQANLATLVPKVRLALLVPKEALASTPNTALVQDARSNHWTTDGNSDRCLENEKPFLSFPNNFTMLAFWLLCCSILNSS